MSAPAVALDPTVRPVVVIRLADASVVATYVSFGFALALALFPERFPSLIAKNWSDGYLVPALALACCLLNAISYLRVAHVLARKPGLIASAALGFFTVVIVVGMAAIEARVVAPWIAGLANPQPRIMEEILAHTYFTLMSALFLPFLAVRFLQKLTLGLVRG